MRLFLIGLALLLTACGQTGPLYLPESDAARQEQTVTSELN